jgi:hypothetical protein
MSGQEAVLLVSWRFSIMQADLLATTGEPLTPTFYLARNFA